MAVPSVVKLVGRWCDMKGIRDFINKLSGDGRYDYDYDPATQTYTQLSGPGTAEDSLSKRIMSKMIGLSGDRYQYSYNPQDQTYEQLSGPRMKKGGKVKMSSASKRADGCATKGKTRGRMV
jgi:hypothetical protein